MKFTETIEKVIKETIEFNVAPCINCGNTNVTLNNYLTSEEEVLKPIQIFTHEGHTSFITGGKCYQCSSIYKKEGRWKYEGAYIWNYHNDIQTLIIQEQLKIKVADDRIKELKKIKPAN